MENSPRLNNISQRLGREQSRAVPKNSNYLLIIFNRLTGTDVQRTP